jgi:hypothetical protein
MAKMKKYGIKSCEVARRSWEADIKRHEIEEAKDAAESLGKYFSKFPKGQITKWIREDRDTR